jgi:hypothetical protein
MGISNMSRLTRLLLAALLPLVAAPFAGCSDDCDTYCRNQGRFMGECLPQFDENWSDLDADWSSKGDFVKACTEQIDTKTQEEIDAACANAGDDERKECEDTIRQASIRNCGDHVNDFNASCQAYWQGVVDFTPGAFDPPRREGDDDDSAPGDDDDSAPADDDSAPADDDSAPADDDSAG